LNVRPLGAEDAGLLEALISSFPFKPYRYYRVYSRKAQIDIMRAEILPALTTPPCLAFHASDDDHSAMVIARALPWDSDFFRVRMARFDYIAASPGAPPGVVQAALDAALQACDAAAIPHLTARVDVEDIPTVDLLQRRGFRLMDALVTYRTRPNKEPPIPGREVGVIREVAPDDADAVYDITQEAFRHYVGRFQHDPHVPVDRAKAFYLEWAKKGLSGDMADKVFVAVNSEAKPIGYLFFRRREPASTAGGVAIHGGGLGACRHDAPGAYAALIRHAALWSHAQGAVAECQTQNYNFSVIRVYEAAGFHYVRAEYTLHAWRGADSP
jgi:hypothetical protein